MTLEELTGYIKDGREIEFRLEKCEYFHSYDGENYNIYDNLNNQMIFKGTLEEELAFEFSENISFEKAIGLFNFDCIL